MIDFDLGAGTQIAGPYALREPYAGVRDDVANALRTRLACATDVRFLRSSTDAVQVAIRAARAFTGRSQILKFEGHFHGWADNVYVSVDPPIDTAGPDDRPHAMPMAKGQDAYAFNETYVAPWNDVEALHFYLDRYRDQTAAIICEPILCATAVIEPTAGFLKALRKAAHKRGPLLIFDESITGLRASVGGAQGLLNVTPDLAVLGDALANGLPVGALCGRPELLEGVLEDAHPAVLTAAGETVRAIDRSFDTMQAHGRRLMDGLRALGLHVQGLPIVFNTSFAAGELRTYRDWVRSDQARLVALVEGLAASGVRISPRGTWFLSTAHTDDDIEAALGATRDVIHR